jgi:hypothetical protein
VGQRTATSGTSVAVMSYGSALSTRLTSPTVLCQLPTLLSSLTGTMHGNHLLTLTLTLLTAAACAGQRQRDHGAAEKEGLRGNRRAAKQLRALLGETPAPLHNSTNDMWGTPPTTMSPLLLGFQPIADEYLVPSTLYTVP